MSNIQLFKAAIAASLMTMAGMPASAAPLMVSGAGTWDDMTGDTSLTRANTAFRFQFTIDSDLPANPTNAFSDFSYVLGDTVVNVLPSDITFFSADAGGGLQLSFGQDDLLSGSGASLLNAQAFLQPTASTAMSFGTNLGSGSGTVSVTAINAAVPEPATWALMILGFGAVGVALRKQSRSVAPRQSII